MELDARTLVYFGTLLAAVAVQWALMRSSITTMKEDGEKLRGNIKTLFEKLDKKNRREETRYRKISMALTAIAVALPTGNPHKADIKGIVDGLASNGDD